MKHEFHTWGDYIYYIEDNKAVLFDYTGNKKIVGLPTSVDGFCVSENIPDEAFATPTQILWIVCRQPTEFGCFVFKHCKLKGLLGIRKFHDAPQQIILNDYSFTDSSQIPVEIAIEEIVFNSLDDMEYTVQVCFPELWESFKHDDPETLESALAMYDFGC